MSGRPLIELLVERGLATDPRTARSLIMQGRVLVDGKRQTAAGKRIPDDSAITLQEAEIPYVSRGAVKLHNCLEVLGEDAPQLAGAVCLDVGSGSGGFTQVLLERGADRVYAVDVGRSMREAKLRTDPRVILLEGVNARELDSALIPEPVDFFTLDVSFISGASLLRVIRPLCNAEASGLFLAKPQFERQPDPADERSGAFADGVVRSRELLSRTLQRVFALTIASPMVVKRVITAHPRGAHGNYEFFFLLALSGDGMSSNEFVRQVELLVQPLELD